MACSLAPPISPLRAAATAKVSYPASNTPGLSVNRKVLSGVSNKLLLLLLLLGSDEKLCRFRLFGVRIPSLLVLMIELSITSR